MIEAAFALHREAAPATMASIDKILLSTSASLVAATSMQLARSVPCINTAAEDTARLPTCAGVSWLNVRRHYRQPGDR
jgi:hypothetical protein